MNLIELKIYLVNKHIHPDAVSFGTGLPYEDEKYCIVKENKMWEVYYCERGRKISFVEFKSEEDACQYLKKLLEGDQSVWLLR